MTLEVQTNWGHLDTDICGVVTYADRQLKFSCGLNIEDKLWKELSARDTEMINRAHRHHHDAEHNGEPYWYILVVSEERDNWYKLTYTCSCDGAVR